MNPEKLLYNLACASFYKEAGLFGWGDPSSNPVKPGPRHPVNRIGAAGDERSSVLKALGTANRGGGSTVEANTALAGPKHPINRVGPAQQEYQNVNKALDKMHAGTPSRSMQGFHPGGGSAQ